MNEMTATEFRNLLDRVADGWNRANPAAAAACFTADAVYVEPPDRQRYIGREALEAFFRGASVEPRRMSMTWHHSAYGGDLRVGFGEYSFLIPGRFAAHGVAVITVRDGLISAWREYQYPSQLSFADFAGDTLRRA